MFIKNHKKYGIIITALSLMLHGLKQQSPILSPFWYSQCGDMSEKEQMVNIIKISVLLPI